MYQKVVQKVSRKLVQEQRLEKYAMLVDSVLFDRKLSASAKCVYAILAKNAWQGNSVKIGQRLIASKLGFSKTTVNEAIFDLVDRKHVSMVGEGKARRIYMLTSNRFGHKQRSMNAGGGVPEELVSGPRKRLAVARTA